MSDDYTFDDFDESALAQIDAIAAATLSRTAPPPPTKAVSTTTTSNLADAAAKRAARLARIQQQLDASKSNGASVASAHLSHHATANTRARATSSSKFRPANAKSAATPASQILPPMKTSSDTGSSPLTNSDSRERTLSPPPPPTYRPVATQPPAYHAPPQPSTSRAPPAASTSASASTSRRTTIDLSTDDSFTLDPDLDFEFDAAAFDEIDRTTAAALAGVPRVPTNQLTRQRTLTGDVINAPPRTTSFSRTKSGGVGASAAQGNATISAGPMGRKTKTWSHQSAVARTKPGAKRNDSKGKGKAKAGEEEGEGEDEEPPPPIPDLSVDHISLAISMLILVLQPPPMTLRTDPDATNEWIFPLNNPKRDYQYNIVQAALFENTLVALPTGLGKTFIAGCVMLNYWRWFPKGKIIFLAPTKPLVAQQIEASHQVCGIPGSDAAELTGMVKDSARDELWKCKRVFYMTPQTFVNDLRRVPSLASQIVLIVIDEAHRATGAYAYATAIRDMMIFNPNFRVLALTATPGSNREAVQAVVDSMHISKIEVRAEDSMDIREYVHKKHFQQIVVDLPQPISEVADAIVAVMQELWQGVSQLLPGANMRTMSDYRPTFALSQLGPNDKWAAGPLSNLGALARALNYLDTQSIVMAYETLSFLETGGTNEAGKKKAPQKNLTAKPKWKTMMDKFNRLRQSHTGAIVHPKMDTLRDLLLQYFSDQQDIADIAGETGGPAKESKVMVFASFRRTVEQIVDQLNLNSPMIRAHRFIGQAASKEGIKGLSQKEQLKVIEQFKKGVFNTLVCTSIGEEGLDIGEVDYIVCYDSHKAPIKMLQRIGRTGRKKDGNISVLVAEGKEESNFEKAKHSYNDVQSSIHKASYELYADVPRLLPAELKPTPKEMVMPIESYVKVVTEGRANSTKSATGAIDKFVTKTKEPKLTAKARKQMLEEAKALVAESSDEDESLSQQISKMKARKGKQKATEDASSTSKSRKPSKKSQSAASGAADASDEEVAVKPKKSRKRSSEHFEADGDDPPKVAKKRRKKKQVDDDQAPDQSDDDEPSTSTKKKAKRKGSTSKKRTHTSSSDDSDDDSPRGKRSRTNSSHRAGSFRQAGSFDSSPPPFVTKPTSGFVTGRGKDLLPTKPAPIPTIDISDTDDDIPPRPQSASPSPSPDPLNIRAGDISLDNPKHVPKSPPLPSSFAASYRDEPIVWTSPIQSPVPSPAKPSPEHPQYSPDWDIDLPSSPNISPIPGPSKPSKTAEGFDWLLGSDDSDDDRPILPKKSLTSTVPRKGVIPQAVLATHSAISPLLSRSRAQSSQSQHAPLPPRSFVDHLVGSMGPPGSRSQVGIIDIADTSIELLDAPPPSQNRRKRIVEASPLSARAGRTSLGPIGNVSVQDASFEKFLEQDGSSSPVRRVGRIKRGRKSMTVHGQTILLSSDEEDDPAPDEDDDPEEEEEPSPVVPVRVKSKHKSKKKKRPIFDRNNAFVAMEADLSGDDASNVGSTDTEGEEDSYDREFIADGDMSQMPDHYAQHAIYRQGLMTQAPGMLFKKPPARVGVFGAAFGGRGGGVTPSPRRQRRLSSSPPPAPGSEDAYEFGSFIVDDDETLDD